MNNIFKKFKNLFSKKSIQGSIAINPHKHWAIMLWIFFVIVIGLIIYSFYLLFQIKNEQIFQVTPTLKEDNSLLKDSLLKNVTESFDQKSKKETDLLNKPIVFPDPSL